MNRFWLPLLLLVCLTAQPGRPRARDLGLAPGVFPPVLSIPSPTLPAWRRTYHADPGRFDPHGRDGDRAGPGNLPVPGESPRGGVRGQRVRKTRRATQVDELGTIEAPIVLTNTLSVGAAVEGVVAYTLAIPGNERVKSVNALVARPMTAG